MSTARRRVWASGRAYTSVPDITVTLSAIVAGRVLDGVTGRAPGTPVRVDLVRDGAVVVLLQDGWYGVVGYLERVLPGHADTDHELRLAFSAEGYRSVEERAVPVPRGHALPVAVPDVLLRPLPVRLRGRVTVSSLDPDPVDGARVRVTGDVGADLVALREPLLRSHPAATPVRGLAAGGPVRQLTAAVDAGATELALNDASGLGPVVGVGGPATVELAAVSVVGPAAGRITLAGPLRRRAPAGAPVRGFGTAGSPWQATAREADAGDGLLRLVDPVPAGTPDAVRIGVAGAAAEYRAVGAVSGPDGYYSLAGVGGVTAIRVTADAGGGGAGGGAAPPVRWVIEYGAVNVVDLRLAP
jgi:hypothetical protein